MNYFYFQQCTRARGAVAAPFPRVSQSLLVKVDIAFASSLLSLLAVPCIVHTGIF